MATKTLGLVEQYLSETNEVRKLEVLQKILYSPSVKMIIDHRINVWYEYYGTVECDYYSITKEDLYQEAQCGVLEALQKYTAEKRRTNDDKSFYSYAGKYIMGKVRQYIVANTRFGTTTDYYCATLVRMKKNGLELSDPTEVIADTLNISVKTVEKMRKMFSSEFLEYASALAEMTTGLYDRDDVLKERLDSFSKADKEFAEDAFFNRYEPKDLRTKYNLSMSETNRRMRVLAMQLFPEYKNYIPKTERVLMNIPIETLKMVNREEIKEMIIHYYPEAVDFSKTKWTRVINRVTEFIADSDTIKREHQRITLKAVKEDK